MIQDQEINLQHDDAGEEVRIAMLDALGMSLAAKRSDAVAARAASGIEDEWLGDEEFYQGYDDANRHEFVNTASKPVMGGEVKKTDTKSTVFPNITQPYVDAAAARVGDMLLPTDDRNFAIEASEIPSMFEGIETFISEPAPVQQAPQQPGMPQQMPQPVAPPQQVQMPNGQMVDLAMAQAAFSKMKAEADRKAEKAQTRVDDWLSESQYHPEVRKVIDDCAKLGSGVLKGPVPVNRRTKEWRRGDMGDFELVIAEEIKPASFRVDPWNLFPDGACGESIHNGAFVWERDYITSKKLSSYKGLPGYIDAQIDLCIEEGPKSHSGSDRLSVGGKKEQFEIWYFHGEITADELRASGCECEDGKKSVPAMVTMVNDRVIRAALNPLDSGDFPYDVIPWKRRPGMPWGMGVARQMRTPQRIVVAATRNLMDNAGLAAGPQLILRRGVSPENGIWEIKPLKMWVEDDDSDGNNNAPFVSVVIPMLQVELMSIINMGNEMAEKVTGLPMLLQGQQGRAPDTVGGMTIMNNNGNSLLRRVARMFDSCITEPHIKRYYAWLMEYSENNDEKGDFNIIARGSTALVERDIQSQEMVNVVQMCTNPVFGKSPSRAIDEFLKSRRFDPAAFDLTDEEKAKMASQPQQPPPQIAVAQIRAQADAQKTQALLQAEAQKTQAELQAEMQIAQLENQTQQVRIKVDTDRDTQYVAAEMRRDQADYQARMAELQVRRELEMLKYANAQKINLETLKVDLARDSMKLNVTKELAAASNALSARKHVTPPAKPVIEPPGRATPGNSYAQ